MAETPTMLFTSQADWEAWLEKEHSNSDGVWLKIAKKGRFQTALSIQEALLTALCYGWIDGKRLKFDDDYYLQSYTPRRKQSPWSAINVAHVERLITAGRMREAGFKEIERAKADGRWEKAYLPQSQMPVPDDFQAALDANPEAHEFFKTLGKSSRFAYLYRLQEAKKPETREKRLREFITMLTEKRKIY
jgi:uncharacterized protein YdeI (YjbR/CyaY-like superfamily)